MKSGAGAKTQPQCLQLWLGCQLKMRVSTSAPSDEVHTLKVDDAKEIQIPLSGIAKERLARSLEVVLK